MFFAYLAATAAAATVASGIAAAGEKKDSDDDNPNGAVVKNIAKAVVIHSIKPFITHLREV